MSIKTELTVFSKHLHWCPVAELPGVLETIGADGLDVTVRPGGHVRPERVRDELPALVEGCRARGYEVVMICTAIHDAEEPHARLILETAAALGIKYYRMGWLEYRPGGTRDGLREISRRLEDLAAMNAHYGIKGGYQNHDGLWFGAAVWDLAMLLDRINSPWLGVQYDILNAAIEGSNSWPLAFDYVAPRVHTLALKDAVWQKSEGRWRVEYRPVGQGWVDFKPLREKWQAGRLAVPLTLHFEYSLGGAETGAFKLSMPREKVLAAMKRDVDFVRSLMNDHPDQSA